jgi:hypothetical protein
MKSTLCALALVVAGCAAPQASFETGRHAASTASAYYCAKDRLNVQGAQLECNWQPTVEAACSQTKSSVLERASLAADPQPGGRCSTGVWLVKVAPRA